MPLNAGLQLQAAQGRMVRQGPVNYAGRDTGMPQKTTAAAPAGMATPAAPARAARPQPTVGQPRPMPARNRTMNQVADVGFNRAAPPRQHINRGAPITGPGPVRGHRELPAQDTSRQRDYMGMAAQNAAQTGVPGAAQQPAYSGMMGQQQANLQQALAQPQPQQMKPAAPTQAYDPNAGKERADQDFITAKYSGPGGATQHNPNPTATQAAPGSGDQQQGGGNSNYGGGQATQNAATDEGTEGSQGSPGFAQFAQNAAQQAGDLFSVDKETGNPIVGALGDLLSGLSGQISREDMDNIKNYFGESLGAYRDIMAGAKGMMDPAQRDAWEDAARSDLQSTVNTDKLANLRMNAAAQGRGGAMSSNADTGIYGSAANALATGERGLAQDRYGRDVAGMQAGMAGLGAGAGALQDLLGEGFTSNKETLAYLLTGMEKGADIGQLLADMLGGKWA